VEAQLHDLLALHLVPGLGPRLIAALVARFGSPAAVLKASSDELQQVPHIGASLAAKLRRSLVQGDVDAELALMQTHETALLQLGTPSYPAMLANIAVPPTLLYMRGTYRERDAEAIAIVGSRNCTAYGIRVAERLGADLARAGFTIVSGLARGIDAAAHRGALRAGGRTLAILAGGLSKIYPPEHAGLAEEVAAAGALLTESGMRMEPLSGMFPARNRIISGLSRGVVVVEAAERSGALITARHAAEQGREVFAVPGPVDSVASAGTLRLLRQGAKLVRHAEDIMEDLNGVAPLFAAHTHADQAPGDATTPLPDLTELQRLIWDSLAGQPRHIDELARELAASVQDLSGNLMMLEMKKVVRRLPGNRYERR
jgi:DNA processing protein